MRAAIASLLLLCCACGDTERTRVSLALGARGVAARRVELSGGAGLTLTRADVAFGPAYLCASEGARAELCEVALAELRGTVVLRALDPARSELGTLDGVTGEVRSSMFDYGISWLLTASTPQPRPETVAQVEGHSAVIEGVLERAGRSLRIRAAIDVAPRARGDAAINGQRTRHEIVGEAESLTLAVDPHAWVDRLDPDALFALDGDGDGRVELAPGTAAHESILQGMVTRAPVTLVW